MSKQEIKEKVKYAVDKSYFKEDIKKLSLFGSYLNGDEKASSDVDLLVEFMPDAKVGFFKLVQMQEDLGKHVGKSIDLLTSDAISEYFRKDVISQAETIYERK